MLQTLSIISSKMNNTNMTWGVGGSLLLHFHELIDHPNDIDILVAENHVAEFNSSISTIGKTKKVTHSDPFRTAYFSKYCINHTDIDVMGGFAIQHRQSVYRLQLHEDSIVDYRIVNGISVPFCSLEDWYVLYWLIPNKQEKAELIENHLKTYGVKHPNLLEVALNQQLPNELKGEIKKYFLKSIYLP